MNNKLKKYDGLTKLADNEKQYKKPPQTVTEKLSPEDIVNLLVNYQEVKFDNLKTGVHTRYYKKNKDNSLDFKLGGTLLRINKEPKYVVLMANGMTWTAQANSIFYQEMSSKDTIDELKEEIEKQKIQIAELVSFIKKIDKDTKQKDQIIEQQHKQITKLENFIKKTKK